MQASLAFMLFAITDKSGYSRVMSRFVRDNSLSFPSFTHASARMPSHLISKSQLGSEDGFSANVASAAWNFVGIDAGRAPSGILSLFDVFPADVTGNIGSA